MKIIKFMPHLKNVINVSVSKKNIPEWYRKSEYSFIDPNGEEIKGAKACIPFLDGMLSGYMFTTPYDFYINTKNEKIEFSIYTGSNIKVETDFIMERPSESGTLIPRPSGHMEEHYVWRNQTGVKLPKGWSLLFTHPLNRFDLPFTTLSAIVDSDKLSSPGNIPFFFKKDVECIVPAGTPFAQLIPIKRSKWKHLFINKYYHDEDNHLRVKDSYYKKKLWTKKEYN